MDRRDVPLLHVHVGHAPAGGCICYGMTRMIGLWRTFAGTMGVTPVTGNIVCYFGVTF